MRQLFQHLDTGETVLLDVPAPSVAPGRVMIRTQASVVSAGTERMLVQFGKANPLQKARQQPEKVQQVLDKARTDGVGATVAAVRGQLGQPLPLGYCNAGIVEAVGAGVHTVQNGDRVVSNGPHAELVVVAETLVSRIPEAHVTFEAAAFTPLAAIGLHGARLAAPSLGERFAVIGLGLVGLLAVQVLQAHGCQVLGIDPDGERVRLARALGARGVDASADPVEVARAFTDGRGVDGVLITAATDSDEPVRQAAAMCRKKGRIVLVGVAGLSLSRELFYERELSFQVSCSYGPGRYDPAYEENGVDYPLPYVRWTEGRNFGAILGLMARQALAVEPLVTHRFPFGDAPRAYELLHKGQGSLGIVLQYEAGEPDHDTVTATTVTLDFSRSAASGTRTRTIGVLGAGTYATQTLLPVLADLDVDLGAIASARGASAGLAARRFGFRTATSDSATIFADPGIGTVFVLTRHDSHADHAAAALAAGKAVFVEKPLAVDHDGLEGIREAWNEAARAGEPCLTVGFNRRFAPHVQRARQLLGTVPGPKALLMTVNAGRLPEHHWINDPTQGGGRLVGEGCHFIDLLRHLAGAPIAEIVARPLGDAPGRSPQSFTLTLRFVDGSLGTLHYLSNGHRRFSKERLEAFVAGRVLILDNFRRLRGFGWPHFRGVRTRGQDKGHRQLVEAFLDAAQGRGPLPIPIEEVFEVSDAVLRARDQIGG